MGLAGLATETLAWVDGGACVAPDGRIVDLGDTVAAAVRGTRGVRPDEAAALVARSRAPRFGTRVEVTAEGTADAGRRLLAEGEAAVGVSNFASARNVGGGFLGGARAQEEELCRASALYRCLEQVPAYYAANRAEPSALYTDHAIVSPRVPFFRDGARDVVDPYLLTVVTSPAPNTGALRQQGDAAGLAQVPDTFRRRAAQVLALLDDAGCDAIVLGAWGCGAFQGDPAVVAEAFGAALDGPFAGRFRRVVFAVLVRAGRDRQNLAAFEARFGAVSR
jgi:uncharacterized protein (TIGR02452 family)